MKTKEKRIRIIILIIVMIVFCMTIVFYNFINPFIIKKFKDNLSLVSSKNNLMVHFISVGQGDAIAVTFPDGTVLLIDSGPVGSAITYTDYIKTKVLANKLNNEIDYLLLTHADMDHCGGTNKLLESFDVKEVIIPKIESDTKSYQNTLKNIKSNVNYRIISDEFCLNINGCKLTCFGPLDYTSTNATCPLIKIEYKNKSFLFTGDLSSKEESDFISLIGDELDTDVLKVGHHGSKTSTSQEFLNKVTPYYSVICTDGEHYGHPSEETLERLDMANSEIYRTDKDGNVLFVVGDNYDLSVLMGNYKITALSLNYVYVVVIIEFGLAFSVVMIITSKTKREKREIMRIKALKKINKTK